MRKNFLKWSTMAFAVVAMTACGNSEKVDYLPCQQEKGQDWGFVDNKGNVYLADEYKNCPSNVIEGVFAVYEDGGYNLYKFDEKKPKLLLEGLTQVGTPRDGLLPVVKNEGRIEIVNLKGKTILELNSFDGNEVTGCAAQFTKNGRLLVYTIDNSGKTHKIYIDKKGKVLLAPDGNITPNNWEEIAEDLYLGVIHQEQGDVDEIVFFNDEKEIQKQWKVGLGDDFQYADEKYIAMRSEDDKRTSIYNMDGEVVLKCPEKVRNISEIVGKLIAFRSENRSCGVMNFDGETVLTAKYDGIKILNNGFLVLRDGKYEILNKDGEKENKLDWDDLDYIEGFGWIGSEGKDEYVLNDKFEAVHKTELWSINPKTFTSNLKNLYVDQNAAVAKTVAALKGDLQSNGFVFGAKANEIQTLKNEWIENFGNWQTQYNFVIGAGNGYTVTASIHFSDRIKERDEDDSKLNPEAEVDVMSVTLSVPGAEQKVIYDQLLESMANSFTKGESKNKFSTKECTYDVVSTWSGIEILIRNAKPASEEDALANEIVDAALEMAE
jgi:hypothetical protein